MSFEKVIAAALMGNADDRQKGLDRISCHAVTAQKIQCNCGEILDQETITVVESRKDGRTVAAYCPSCWQRGKGLWDIADYRIVTWGK